MEFIPYYRVLTESFEPGWWFIFSGTKLLVKRSGEGVQIPFGEGTFFAALRPIRKQFLGTLDGKPCYSAECDPQAPSPDGMGFVGLRALFRQVSETFFSIAGRASFITNWDRTHQFCSQCGHAVRDKDEERAKLCPSCGFVSFPVMSSAVIVAVTRGDELLLANASRFPAEMYSVIAGFVDPGESLEECVRREIKEEVGLEVGNIRYFGSQPWPFPNSLMIGFTAEHRNGKIRVDQKEIVDAGWFKADRLPKIPEKISIARRLIDWFVEGKRQDQ
jgi:NAD+ diphosphatase